MYMPETKGTSEAMVDLAAVEDDILDWLNGHLSGHHLFNPAGTIAQISNPTLLLELIRTALGSVLENPDYPVLESNGSASTRLQDCYEVLSFCRAHFPDFPREIAVNDLADGTVEQLLAVLGFIYTSELHAASSAPSTSSPDPDLLEMVQDKLQAEIDRLTHACRQEQERVRVLSDDNDRLHYEVGEARTDVALMRLEMDKLRHMKESTDDELKQSVEAERLAAAELARTQAALAAQLEHSQAASAEIMTLRRAEHDAKETAGSLRERVRELGSQLRAGEGRAAGREEGAPQTKAIAIGLQELRDGMRVVQANLSKSEKKHRVDTGLGRGAVSRGCSADAADSGVVRAGLGVMVVAMGMASVAVAVFA